MAPFPVTTIAFTLPANQIRSADVRFKNRRRVLDLVGFRHVHSLSDRFAVFNGMYLALSALLLVFFLS